MTPADARRLAYGGFMLLALVLFLLARRVLPKPAGLETLPWWKRFALLLAAFIGGSLGGKLPFVISSIASWLSGSPSVNAFQNIGVEILSAWFSEPAKSIRSA